MTSTEIGNASKIMLGSTEADAMYIGTTLMWLKQTTPVSRLPQGYTELEYIESTRDTQQYIDLDIKLYQTLNTDYDIAIKFNILDTSYGTNGQGVNATIFGCQNTTSPWPGTFIRKSGTTNNNRYVIIGRYIGGSNKDNQVGFENEIIELPVLTPPNKNVTSYNNSGRTHNFGTSLFCTFSNESGTSTALFCSAKLYYFKLFVEGTLVRDMVPCKNSNNVVGLYDLANDVFYSSPNGAAFVAGPAV